LFDDWLIGTRVISRQKIAVIDVDVSTRRLDTTFATSDCFSAVNTVLELHRYRRLSAILFGYSRKVSAS